MDIKLIKAFLNAYPIAEISPAKLEYALYLKPDLGERAQKIAADRVNVTEKDLADKKMIESAVKAEELIRLMRRPMARSNTDLLREKLLFRQQEMALPIMERLYTSGHDIFVENALHFLLHCDVNYAKFLYKEYDEFRSEYAKSMICLVLGFRGMKEMIPMLMHEAQRMELQIRDELMAQGPILAVQELGVRFYGLERIV